MMSSRNPSYTNPTPCDHLSDYKLKHGLAGYKSIQNLIQTSPNGRTSLHKLDSNIPRCTSCNGYSKRLYYCLICSSIFCSDHTFLHAQSESGHDISVDILRAELFCFPCSDQVYDPDFDKIVMSSHILGVPKIQERSESIGQRLSKRRRLTSSSPPIGLGMELVDLKKLKPLTCIRDKKAKSCYPLGLRGLNNLGNTCFMNSVLQALLNAPPLRNYFLSDQHSREICRKRSGDQLCLQCDIARIFAAVFSGDRNTYSPAQFLYSWWQHSASFASYEQQDAHEFFISVLERIHEREGKFKNQSKDCIDCKCIAHKAFYGQLRSDVTCLTCGFTSTTFDPCVDISLNLDSNNHSLRDISTLSSCLNLFTRPEKLGSDQKLFCQNCQERQDSLKQMSIGKLPLVLCLHIKRFEHSSIKNMSRKIDRHLLFPFSLEMRPYLSSSIVRKRFGNRIFALEGDEPDGSSEFEIFAVIAHSGGLESGHYVTYLRLRNQWYKCDDAWITEVDVWVVRNCQCYMMFYLQKSSASSTKQHGDLI